MADEGELRVTLARGPAPRSVQEQGLRLPAGATVGDAVAASGWRLAGEGLALFVWGRAASASQPLQDGDRVELLRGLRVDPKVARRERAGARRTRAQR